MGPNQDKIYEEVFQVKNSEEICDRLKEIQPLGNGIVANPVISLVIPKDYSLMLYEYKEKLWASSKMPDSLKKNIVKTKNFELGFVRVKKRSNNKINSKLILNYPLSTIAFDLTIPKHIPMVYDKPIVVFKSNFASLSPPVPAPFVSSSSLYHQKDIEVIDKMLASCQKNILLTLPDVNNEDLLHYEDQNESKNLGINCLNKEAICLSEYYTSVIATESVKNIEKDTSTPSSSINKIVTCVLKPNIKNTNCGKYKYKTEPNLKKKNKFENSSAISFNPSHLLGNDLLRYKQKVNADIDNEFDFTIEAEKMVSSICDSSPPKGLGKKDLFCSKFSDPELNSSRPDPMKFKTVFDKTKNTSQNSLNEDWSKNVYSVCKTFSKNKPKLGCILNNQFSSEFESFEESLGVENVTSKNSTKINQETLLFRTAALNGCYNIGNILGNAEPKCPEVEEECNSVKKSIFAAIRDIRSINTFLSDSCLSFLQIIKSWISLSSHFENPKVETLLKTINPLLADQFNFWQCDTRIFMENMLKCLNLINNESSLIKSQCELDIDKLKTISPSKNNYLSNVSIQNITNFKLFKTSNVASEQKLNGNIISDQKSNLTFFATREQFKIPDTNNFFKEMYSKLESTKNASPQKNLKQTQFSKFNSLHCDKIQSSSFQSPFQSNNIPNDKLQPNLTNSLDCPSVFIPEENKMFDMSDGFLKNNSESVNNNFPNLIEPSFFNKSSDDYCQSNQFVNSNNFCNNPGMRNPLQYTSPILLNPSVPNFENPLHNPTIPESRFKDTHINYEKDNATMNVLKCNTNVTSNIQKLNEQSLYNVCNSPYYVPALGAIGTSQPLMYYDQQVMPITNSINSTDNDSDVKTSYMKPGFYQVPLKPEGCLRPSSFKFPVEDTPVLGVPFVYSNRLNKSQPVTLVQKTPTQQLNCACDKSDETWKAAVACAESLCETLMMKPVSENEFNGTSLYENSTETLFTENNSNLDLRDDYKNSIKNVDSLSVPVTEPRFVNVEWSLNSFNQPVQNNTNGYFRLDKCSEKDVPSEKITSKSLNNGRQSISDNNFLSFKAEENNFKDSDLLNASSKEYIENFELVGESNTLDVEKNKKQKYDIISNLNSKKQLNIFKNETPGDLTTYLPNKSNFGWCRTNPQQTINSQTCSKLQDIVDSIWKIDIVKFLKTVNNSKQELQNIESKIKCPTFLQQITHKIQNHEYATTDQALSDFQHFFNNVRITNRNDKTIVSIVNKLEKIYDKLIEKHFGVEDNFEKKHDGFGPIGSMSTTKFKKQKKSYRNF